MILNKKIHLDDLQYPVRNETFFGCTFIGPSMICLYGGSVTHSILNGGAGAPDADHRVFINCAFFSNVFESVMIKAIDEVSDFDVEREVHRLIGRLKKTVD